MFKPSSSYDSRRSFERCRIGGDGAADDQHSVGPIPFSTLQFSSSLAASPIPIFDIHNWTAYIALALVCLHPILLLCSSSAGFRIIDVLWPIHSPKQTLYNCFGALAFYCVVFVVVTSYLRARQSPLEKAPPCCLRGRGLLLRPRDFD